MSDCPRWEYLVVEEPSTNQLIIFGGEGWELVAVVMRPDGFGGSMPNCYFKRPVPFVLRWSRAVPEE